MPISNRKLFDLWDEIQNEESFKFNSETSFLNTNLLLDGKHFTFNLTNSTVKSSEKDGISFDYQLKGLNFNWIYILVVFLIILGVLGNCLVCLAISLEKRLQNATNYFLLSLAVADLFVSLIVMPFLMLFDLYGYWPFGTGLCNFWVTCDVLLCSSSIIHMCFISVGRYIGIRHPLTARRVPLLASRKAAMFKILIAWLIAAFITSPISIAGLIDTKNIQPKERVCAINNRLFFILGSIVSFFLPMLIMVNTYILTARLLKRKAKLCQENAFMQQQHHVNVSSRQCIHCKGNQLYKYRRSNSMSSFSSEYSSAPIFAGCLTNPNLLDIQTVETQFTCTVQKPHLTTQITYSKNYPSNTPTTNLSDFPPALNSFRNWTSSSSSSLNLNRNISTKKKSRIQKIPTPSSFTSSILIKNTNTKKNKFNNQSASSKANVNLDSPGVISKIDTTINKNNNLPKTSPPKSFKFFCCPIKCLNNLLNHYNRKKNSKYNKDKNNKHITNKSLQNNEHNNETYQLNTINCLSCSLSKKNNSLLKSQQFSSLEDFKLKNHSSKNYNSNKPTISLRKTSSFNVNFQEPASISSGHNNQKQSVKFGIHHDKTDILPLSNKKILFPLTTSSSFSSVTYINNLHFSNQGTSKTLNTKKTSQNIDISTNFNPTNSNLSTNNVNNSNSKYSQPVLVRSLGSNQVLTEQKATKVLGVVFFVFIVCWVPFFTHNFLLGVWPDLVNKLPSSVATTLQWLGYVSSTLNPIIYTFFNRNFRRTFRRIITCQIVSNTKYKLVKCSPRLNSSTKMVNFHNSSVHQLKTFRNKSRLNRNIDNTNHK